MRISVCMHACERACMHVYVSLYLKEEGKVCWWKEEGLGRGRGGGE